MSDDFDAFLEEAESHAWALERGALEIEEGRPAAVLLPEMFRAAHSIKGAAGLLDLGALAKLTHGLENVLGELRDGRIAWSGGIAQAVLDASDALRQLLLAGPEVAAAGVPCLAAVHAALEAAARVAPDSAPEGPGEAGAGSPGDLPGGAEPLADLPVGPGYLALMDEQDRALLGRLAAERRYLYEISFSLDGCAWSDGEIDHPALERLRALGRLLAVLPQDPPPPPDGAGFTFRARALFVTTAEPPLLKMLVPVAGEWLETRFDPTAPPHAAAVPPEAAAAVPPEADAAAPEPATRPPRQASIRVAAWRLDDLVDVVGEVVIAHARVMGLTGALAARHPKDPEIHALSEALDRMERLMSDLRNLSIGLRMIPLERVFGKLPRQVRDLARTLGKQLRVEIGGAETELDRHQVEALEDPLVHLLRNSADHGIESPEARRRAGKEECGTIRVAAGRQGSSIVITVSDDGAGIDPARVRARARELGLPLPEPEAGGPDEGVLQLLFQPGFSTARGITAVSGRGVGLDVVAQNVRKLKGTIQVSSRPGEGTEFRINVPLTLAITKALLVEAGGSTCALPVDAVRESVRLAGADVCTVRGREVLKLRDRILPLVRLPRFFDRSSADGTPLRGGVAVIVEPGGEDFGLVVDAVHGEQDLVIKPLGDLVAVPGLSGGAILGDGRIALVLDPGGIAGACAGE